jgi:hypothetical protein
MGAIAEQARQKEAELEDRIVHEYTQRNLAQMLRVSIE